MLHEVLNALAYFICLWIPLHLIAPNGLDFRTPSTSTACPIRLYPAKPVERIAHTDTVTY
eukprot:7417259-Alexandrium_andersonii.AAC.1